MGAKFYLTTLVLGVLIAVVMTAANVYLGLYAGMTVSASIPAAVVAMGVFRALKRSDIHQSNLVQTMASAGESLAAGIIFTVPALILVGVWTEFKFWPTTIIGISGGLLGILFMIPLRRVLILQDKRLTYPEGVACASVLKAGESGKGGLQWIVKGLLIGGVVKILSTGLSIVKGTVEGALQVKNSIFYAGTDISPALIAVGYIVQLRVAVLVFFGGCLGWLGVLPFLDLPVGSASSLDTAWTLWSTQIRYIGVGAMIVGSVVSLVQIRQGFVSAVQMIRASFQKSKLVEKVMEGDRDISMKLMLLFFGIASIFMGILYIDVLQHWGLGLFVTLLMIFFCFLFAAVSSYIVGLVGSSNNPVSGMTITVLLGSSGLIVLFGFTGSQGILAALGVASVVCCAACIAGDCSQDLKTGHLIGASPRLQQIAQIIGVTIPAFVIAPVLTILHSSYGIGDQLKAPQATLFANLAQGIFGDGVLPGKFIAIGMGLAVVLLALNTALNKFQISFRFHIMPVAVGVYLPLSLSVPIVLGGLVQYVVSRMSGRHSDDPASDNGVLFGSGLIAGEALMGVILAIAIYFNMKSSGGLVSGSLSNVLSLGVLFLLLAYLYRAARQSSK